MSSVSVSFERVQVNLRKAAGLIRRAKYVYLTLPWAALLEVTKAEAKKMLADLRFRGVKRTTLLLCEGCVQLNAF